MLRKTKKINPRPIHDPAADAQAKTGVPFEVRKVWNSWEPYMAYTTTDMFAGLGRGYKRHCGPVSVTNAILTAIISISIMVVGHSLALRGETVKGVAELAMGLEPLAGAGAKAIFSIGIFAAGISSATTAPLAATYVITGILGWSTDLKDTKFRTITTIVFILGCIVAIMGGTPTNIITIAQAVNGVALPLSVCLVVYVASSSKLLGTYKNSGILNIAGLAVLVITLFMAYRTFTVYAPALMKMLG